MEVRDVVDSEIVVFKSTYDLVDVSELCQSHGIYKHHQWAPPYFANK